MLETNPSGPRSAPRDGDHNMPVTGSPVKLIEGALALGFSLSEAVQRALGESLTAWGARRAFGQSEVSMCLRFYENRVYGEIRDALASDLGTDRERVDRWIADQAASSAAA